MYVVSNILEKFIWACQTFVFRFLARDGISLHIPGLSTFIVLNNFELIDSRELRKDAGRFGSKKIFRSDPFIAYRNQICRAQERHGTVKGQPVCQVLNYKKLKSCFYFVKFRLTFWKDLLTKQFYYYKSTSHIWLRTLLMTVL